jgi:CIC family chloride channel protein
MLPEVSTRTFLPVALATGTATFLGRMFFGDFPAFDVPPVGTLSVHASALYILGLYAVLGVLVGVAAAAFIRGLHFAEDLFERIANPYLRAVLGMGLVGLMMYGYLRGTGHYHIEGVGYATIQDVLLGSLATAPLLALLCVSKLVATCMSLGSGSSGGIFSPSLFMGATLGGAFGALCHAVFPTADIPVAAFAMVGMGAMVGGGTGAAMTAVTMIFEMTRDYQIVVPLIMAVAISIGCRWVLSRENIYTIKLIARRHFVPKALHANMFLVRRAADVMDKDVLVLPGTTAFHEFLKMPGHENRLRHVVITDHGRISGVLRVNTALRRGLEDTFLGVTLADVASRQFTLVHGEDIMFTVIGRMWRLGAGMAIVVQEGTMPRADTIRGVITKEHVADSVADSIRPYSASEVYH